MNFPAVRFVRMYDWREGCMRNVWTLIHTQEQWNNAPRATEITSQGPTFEAVLDEVRPLFEKFNLHEEFEKVVEASELLNGKPSTYGVWPNPIVGVNFSEKR